MTIIILITNNLKVKKKKPLKKELILITIFAKNYILMFINKIILITREKTKVLNLI